MRGDRNGLRARRGLAVLEVVILTATALTMAWGLYKILLILVKKFFPMLGNGVAWPYL